MKFVVALMPEEIGFVRFSCWMVGNDKSLGGSRRHQPKESMTSCHIGTRTLDDVPHES